MYLMHVRVIRNRTDWKSLSMPNPMTYLKNFLSNRPFKNDKKVVSWHCPKFDQIRGEILFPEVWQHFSLISIDNFVIKTEIKILVNIVWPNGLGFWRHGVFRHSLDTILVSVRAQPFHHFLKIYLTRSCLFMS